MWAFLRSQQGDVLSSSRAHYYDYLCKLLEPPSKSFELIVIFRISHSLLHQGCLQEDQFLWLILVPRWSYQAQYRLVVQCYKCRQPYISPSLCKLGLGCLSLEVTLRWSGLASGGLNMNILLCCRSVRMVMIRGHFGRPPCL